MLVPITQNLWSIQHHFLVSGVPATSRMTVVRLENGDLWLHSPVPLHREDKAALDALGEVKAIVAPSKLHHLFAGPMAEMYPQAKLYGAPGLAKKRPDLRGLLPLEAAPGNWAPELSYHLFQGIPAANETVWFHAPSGTLILTDLCQWWRGSIGWKALLWNLAVGTRKQFNVPRTVRALVRDREAARTSAQQILQWPITRIVMAHNTIIEENAKAQLTHAFRHFL